MSPRIKSEPRREARVGFPSSAAGPSRPVKSRQDNRAPRSNTEGHSTRGGHSAGTEGAALAPPSCHCGVSGPEGPGARGAGLRHGYRSPALVSTVMVREMRPRTSGKSRALLTAAPLWPSDGSRPGPRKLGEAPTAPGAGHQGLPVFLLPRGCGSMAGCRGPGHSPWARGHRSPAEPGSRATPEGPALSTRLRPWCAQYMPTVSSFCLSGETLVTRQLRDLWGVWVLCPEHTGPRASLFQVHPRKRDRKRWGWPPRGLPALSLKERLVEVGTVTHRPQDRRPDRSLRKGQPLASPRQLPGQQFKDTVLTEHLLGQAPNRLLPPSQQGLPGN